MDRNDIILFGSFLAALAAVVLAAAARSSSSETVATWFEALGVVGAFIVAIVMPLKIESNAAAKAIIERGERTYSVASSLTGAIWLLDIEISRTERKIVASAGAPPEEPMWQDWVTGLKLAIPPALMAALPLMHGLQGNIIGPFRTAAMLSDTFNGYTDRWAKLPYNGIAQNWPVLHGQIGAQIMLLRRTVVAVQAQFPRRG